MKKKIIGLLICTLLIANISAVLGVPEDKTKSIEKTESFIMANPFNQENMRYVILHNDIRSRTSRGNVAGTYDNLAPNPSFEDGDSMPTGWTYYTASSGKFNWDSNYSHSGEKSIGISNLFKPTVWINWETINFIPVDSFENTYKFSVWYKYLKQPQKNQYAGLCVDLFDEKYGRIMGYFFPLDFSLEWTQNSMFSSWFNPDELNVTKYVKLELVQADLSTGITDRLVEVRFDDVYFGIGESNPPNKPETPLGSTDGKIGIDYNYTTSAVDSDEDDIAYFFDWGDGTNSGWTELYESGEVVSISHNWTQKGNYQIKVKAKDIWLIESDWSDPLTITMPYSYNPILRFLELLFERFPNAFPILKQMFGN